MKTWITIKDRCTRQQDEKAKDILTFIINRMDRLYAEKKINRRNLMKKRTELYREMIDEMWIQDSLTYRSLLDYTVMYNDLFDDIADELMDEAGDGQIIINYINDRPEGEA